MSRSYQHKKKKHKRAVYPRGSNQYEVYESKQILSPILASMSSFCLMPSVHHAKLQTWKMSGFLYVCCTVWQFLTALHKHAEGNDSYKVQYEVCFLQEVL